MTSHPALSIAPAWRAPAMAFGDSLDHELAFDFAPREPERHGPLPLRTESAGGGVKLLIIRWLDEQF